MAECPVRSEDSPGLGRGRPGQIAPGEEALVARLIQSLEFPAAEIEEVVVGRRFVGVRSRDRVGLASTLGARPNSNEERLVKDMKGWPLKRAAGLLRQGRGFILSLGLAALNGGFSPPTSPAAVNVSHLLSSLGRGKEVLVVGDFPFTSQVERAARRLYLLELKDVPGRLAEAEWAAALSRCQVAAITATTILTRSLARFIGLSPQATRILVGPSTPWAEVLFELGVDVLAGSVITRPQEVLEAVARDLSFREIKRAGARPVLWARRPELIKGLFQTE